MAREWSSADEEWLNGVRSRVRGWLLATMEELDLTSAEVSRRTGLQTSTLSSILSGKRSDGKQVPLGVDTLARISRGLGLSPKLMIEEDPPPVERIPTGRTGVPVQQPAAPAPARTAQVARPTVTTIVGRKAAHIRRAATAKAKKSGP
jgi:transcriptional regulator with XRE-family HTH domain